MLTFIRGQTTFFGPGQIYVKLLPNGEPVAADERRLLKMAPKFSPDGSRIAYAIGDAQPTALDTWVVPVLGGQPQRCAVECRGSHVDQRREPSRLACCFPS